MKFKREEIENEKSNQILETVNEILDFNKEIQKQRGSSLKMLIPNQMLSRLTISLAQLKSGNNSEKRKNEVRQIVYSLYRSKKLTKHIYKSWVDIIEKWRQSLWTLKTVKQMNHADLDWIWQIHLISKTQTKTWLS